MNLNKHLFYVPPFSIPYSNTWLSDTLRLNQFQAEVYELLGKEKYILLTAPTGGGKTLTLLLNTEPSQTGLSGFAALYPNNTLLRNQMCTVEDIIVEHLGATLVDSSQACQKPACSENGKTRRCECTGPCKEGDCVEPLTIYSVDRKKAGNAWIGFDYIGFLLLSGRYIQSEDGVPKREVLYKLAEKALRYARKGGIYLVVFATPDTYLLALTGAYQDFDRVGKALHNILLALASGEPAERLEYILRRTQVLPRSAVDMSASVVQRLLDLPLFIDEFHLYGLYELDALHALLKLYNEVFSRPIVFSSATPAHDIMKELREGGSVGEHVEVRAQVIENGPGFKVRGATEFELIPVATGRKGMPAYYLASGAVGQIVVRDLEPKLRSLGGERALIILERLWMVSEVVRELSSRGIEVDCIATITPRDTCKPGAKVIVGSEATTQGVNLGKVVLGITGGTSSEDVVQRIGRVGRRGVSSKVYLVLPDYALEESPPKSRMGYYDMVEWVNAVYPDYPKRKRDISKLIPGRYHEIRRKLIYTLGIASLARVSGMTGLLNKIDIKNSEALDLLDSIVGPPGSLVKLIVFRRSGFNVKYLVEDTGEIGETSIGLITRNFEIKGVTRYGVIKIVLKPKRQTLSIKQPVDPLPFRNKIVDIRAFLSLTNGRIEAGDTLVLEKDQVGDALVYVLDAGDELAEHLSYTGEGAEIVTPSGRRYAIVFV